MLAMCIIALAAWAQDPTPDTTPPGISESEDVPKSEDAPESDDDFEGTWELISVRVDGESRPTNDARLRVAGGQWREVNEHHSDRIFWKVRRRVAEPWPRVERTRTIRRGIGTIVQGMRGIYRLSDDTLTFAFGPAGGSPPEDLDPAPGRTVEVWRRVRVEPPPDR